MEDYRSQCNYLYTTRQNDSYSESRNSFRRSYQIDDTFEIAFEDSLKRRDNRDPLGPYTAALSTAASYQRERTSSRLFYENQV